jgi:hypothetical protein
VDGREGEGWVTIAVVVPNPGIDVAVALAKTIGTFPFTTTKRRKAKWCNKDPLFTFTDYSYDSNNDGTDTLNAKLVLVRDWKRLDNMELLKVALTASSLTSSFAVPEWH